MSEHGALCHRVYFLIHLVGGPHNARVGLIGALASDEIDELVDHAYVRLFGVALQQRAQAFLAARIADRRVSRSGGWGEKIAPDTVQAGRVYETGELDLSAVLRRCLAGQGIAYGAVGRDREILGSGWNRDLRFERLAVESHHVSFPVEM